MEQKKNKMDHDYCNEDRIDDAGSGQSTVCNENTDSESENEGLGSDMEDSMSSHSSIYSGFDEEQQQQLETDISDEEIQENLSDELSEEVEDNQSDEDQDDVSDNQDQDDVFNSQGQVDDVSDKTMEKDFSKSQNLKALLGDQNQEVADKYHTEAIPDINNQNNSSDDESQDDNLSDDQNREQDDEIEKVAIQRDALDDIDNLFLSYAGSFKKLSVKLQTMLKLDMAKLFARYEMRNFDEDNKLQEAKKNPVPTNVSSTKKNTQNVQVKEPSCKERRSFVLHVHQEPSSIQEQLPEELAITGTDSKAIKTKHKGNECASTSFLVHSRSTAAQEQHLSYSIIGQKRKALNQPILSQGPTMSKVPALNRQLQSTASETLR